MGNTIDVRGLSHWEFVLLKEILAERLAFAVNVKRYKNGLHKGAISIKPSKDDRYYWNKLKFGEIRDLLESLGAEYNHIGVPEHLIHSVYSNGFLCVKFKVDESNRLMFPGLVPRVCTMYQRFDTRSDAEKFKEKQSQILGKELFIGIHPKDGYVVYSTAQ